MSVPLQREEELFATARALADPAERRSYLDRHCGRDSGLRRRVEALLAAETGAEAFFAESGSSLNLALAAIKFTHDTAGAPRLVRPRTAGEEPIGSRIGRYKLLAKLGEGGCGVVYLAEQQEPVHRQVALKIIKLGMETKSVVARFEAERQALAMMDHPNIARVFDAGATDRGPPYFVMELVRGVKITSFCDQHRLDVRRRLELFICICHAIQHAHQKGIIHGDIKPSNIMVSMQDGTPVPKVIDFGISKATEVRLTDRMAFTACAQFIGTPAYMSPEQMEFSELGIDTRSDIYSLGVVLYELLTGLTPFDARELAAAGMDQMRRIVREREAPRPSSRLHALPSAAAAATAASRCSEPGRLTALLRGDLDWIVMRTLEKDRARRYETANGLAMDVQRHLDYEPVVARPPSRIYRFRKLVRRNRITFAAAAAVAAALVAGMGTSTWLFLKERQARQRAVAAERQEAHLRQEAEFRQKITQAELSANQGKFREAGSVLDQIHFTAPTVEGAAALRSVGEWHALRGRWAQAASRFRTLLKVDRFDGEDVETLDYLRLGPALLEAGDIAAYDHFRRTAIARFAGTSFGFPDRIIKISLLTPASPGVLESLAPLAKTTEQSLAGAEASGDVFMAAWRCMALGLWAYRRGDYQEADAWCRRCLAYTDNNAPRNATARLILAMANTKLGRLSEAQRELAEGREVIERKFQGPLSLGTPVLGFWFDWDFARIILREAARVVGSASPAPPTSTESSAP